VKSEVPLADEPVGRLEGIGEQAVATLKALGQQIGHSTGLPLHLAAVEKVRKSLCWRECCLCNGLFGAFLARDLSW
jgi:hypothetical protein